MESGYGQWRNPIAWQTLKWIDNLHINITANLFTAKVSSYLSKINCTTYTLPQKHDTFSSDVYTRAVVLYGHSFTILWYSNRGTDERIGDSYLKSYFRILFFMTDQCKFSVIAMLNTRVCTHSYQGVGISNGLNMVQSLITILGGGKKKKRGEIHQVSSIVLRGDDVTCTAAYSITGLVTWKQV